MRTLLAMNHVNAMTLEIKRRLPGLEKLVNLPVTEIMTLIKPVKEYIDQRMPDRVIGIIV